MNRRIRRSMIGWKRDVGARGCADHLQGCRDDGLDPQPVDVAFQHLEDFQTVDDGVWPGRAYRP
ncbi:hypothetical protein AB0C96_41135 [Streptomyces sp. NPDC048506]|uniref:hypothetical protein n=1 Tax=Streptomyces sp. NPDC048506 TaxID=3155028 RepID=UPI003425AC5C